MSNQTGFQIWLILVLSAIIGITAVTKHSDWFDGSGHPDYVAVPEQ